MCGPALNKRQQDERVCWLELATFSPHAWMGAHSSRPLSPCLGCSAAWREPARRLLAQRRCAAAAAPLDHSTGCPGATGSGTGLWLACMPATFQQSARTGPAPVVPPCCSLSSCSQIAAYAFFSRSRHSTSSVCLLSRSACVELLLRRRLLLPSPESAAAPARPGRLLWVLGCPGQLCARRRGLWCAQQAGLDGRLPQHPGHRQGGV